MTNHRLFYSGPWCPNCGSEMVKRIPREGQSFESFYGCRSFPRCDGALPLDWEARLEQGFLHVKEIWRNG